MRLYECPLSYLSEETFEVMRFVFLAEDSGHLPFGCGWADQPFWFWEAYQIYKTEAAASRQRETEIRKGV